MPLHTFPKFLEIWLQGCLGAGMPPPPVFRGKPLCAHAAVLSRKPCNQPLFWPWHTQRRKRWLLHSHRRLFFVHLHVHQRHSFSFVPFNPHTAPCTHFTHSSHTLMSSHHKSEERGHWFLGIGGQWPSLADAARCFLKLILSLEAEPWTCYTVFFTYVITTKCLI